MDIKDYSERLLGVKSFIESKEIIKYFSIEDTSGQFQYKGLKWLRCLFNDNVKLKDEYKDDNVVGFHIMPYRIKPEHLKHIVCSDTEHKFKIQNNNFTDYDPKTGNIHICPNGIWQIVLVKKQPNYGPGFLETNSKEFNIYERIKPNYYFPRIDSNENDLSAHKIELSVDSTNDEALLKLIQDVINEITE